METREKVSWLSRSVQTYVFVFRTRNRRRARWKNAFAELYCSKVLLLHRSNYSIDNQLITPRPGAINDFRRSVFRRRPTEYFRNVISRWRDSRRGKRACCLRATKPREWSILHDSSSTAKSVEISYKYRLYRCHHRVKYSTPPSLSDNFYFFIWRNIAARRVLLLFPM